MASGGCSAIRSPSSARTRSRSRPIRSSSAPTSATTRPRRSVAVADRRVGRRPAPRPRHRPCAGSSPARWPTASSAPTSSRRGLGPIIRSIDVLLELARYGEGKAAAEDGREERRREGRRREGCQREVAAIGPQKRRLYRLGSFVRALERIRSLAWVCCRGSPGTAHRRRRLGALHPPQVRYLISCPATVAVQLTSTDQERFETGASALLASSAEHPRPPRARCRDREPPKGYVDLRGEIIDVLEQIHHRDQAQPPGPAPARLDPAKPDARNGAEVIQRVLTDAAAADWAMRLASLEVLLVDEHLLGAPGTARSASPACRRPRRSSTRSASSSSTPTPRRSTSPSRRTATTSPPT